MAKESFKYKIVLKYINSYNTEIEINSEQIQHVVIDKDFDNNNFPVIGITGAIDKNVLDDMIINMNDNIITLGIYSYDIANQNDSITEKYFNDRFLYIIDEDISKTSELDYPDGEDNPGLYKDVTIWLLPQDAVNNNRQSINGIFKNATTNTLILQTSNYLGRTLLEPVTYDNKYKQIIIPPQESISEYIAYLNNNLSVFYDTGYRFFIDFDMTYIMSTSGKIVKTRDQNIFTVDINISESIIPDDADEEGMVVDIKRNKYVITVNRAHSWCNRNRISNKIVNKLTVIDSSGNVTERVLQDNQTKSTTLINRIINLSNTDSNAINNLSNTIQSNNVTLTIVKNDLDASIFTMNKEYIITDPAHDEYNGRYLLTSVKQLFTNQMDYFTMTVILNFRKI